MEKEKIKEIIYNHRIWINRRQEGKRADFRGEDLSRVDFRGKNLYGANFSGAKLCKANFYGTVLMSADFSKSDLSNADLRKTFLNKADFSGSNLRGIKLDEANVQNVNLEGAILPDYFFMVSIPDSECTWGVDRNYIYYNAKNDVVIYNFGNWDKDYLGNKLNTFIKLVDTVYGPKAEKENPLLYNEYISAIKYFETCRNVYYEYGRSNK